jgi:hypothetical protein
MERLILLIVWLIIIWALGRLGKKKRLPRPEEKEEEEVLPPFFEEKPYPEEKVIIPAPFEEKPYPKEKVIPFSSKEVSPPEKLEEVPLRPVSPPKKLKEVPSRPKKIAKPHLKREEEPSFLGEGNIFRQGIILSEILGPPRAKRRLRPKIRPHPSLPL